MTFRDVSYYGWQDTIIAQSSPDEVFREVDINNIAQAPNGNIYAVGFMTYANGNNDWVVYRLLKNSSVWELVDKVSSDVATANKATAYAVAVDSDNNVYVCGSEAVTGQAVNWIIRKSTTGASGSFSYIDSLNRDDGNDLARAIAIDSSGSVYVCGAEEVTGEGFGNGIIRKSTTGASGSFSYIDSFDFALKSDSLLTLVIDSGDNVYAGGIEAAGGGSNWLVRKSTTGASGSFSNIDSVLSGALWAMTIDSSGNVYAAGGLGSSQVWTVRKSTTGASASFSEIDSHFNSVKPAIAYSIATDSSNNVYAAGLETQNPGSTSEYIVRKAALGGAFSTLLLPLKFEGDFPRHLAARLAIFDDNIHIAFSGKKARMRVGKLTTNSASLGSKMLASSIGYVQEETSGSLIEKFKLNNVSEFPHSSGIFQMPNLVLGTQDSGEIGNNDDSIVQVNHFGSVVKVMWPKQKDQKALVKGFGDFSAGQRVGKLTTTFSPGTKINVEEYDSLALYCYILKNLSGTLDQVEVKVERKPVDSAGFTTEQALEYEGSGSFTVAKLTDLLYKKEVNYGDLSIREVTFPIDYSLRNVKEVRVSARHVNGQEDDNKNFIIWARLIKASKDTNET